MTNARQVGADRPLPANLEAERCVLAAIICKKRDHVAALALSAGDFSSHAHRLIYKVLQKRVTAQQPTDVIFVIDDLGDDIEAAGGVVYLSGLLDPLYFADVAEAVRVIHQKAHLRQLATLGELAWTANGDAGQLLEQVKTLSAHIGMEFGQKQSSNLFRTAADLAEESSQAEFLVKPYVLRSAVTELVAKIKVGKTTYVLGEIVRQGLENGPVVYLTEQPKASFRVALERAHLLGREDLVVLPFHAVIGMDWPSIARMALEKCHETSAVLLVVDTLSRFCGLDGDSENQSGDALTAMTPLQGLASQGTAVLTVRHERKSGGEIGDAGRGSSAFGGAADTLLTLRRPEGRTRPTIRKIECISRFDGLPAEALYEYLDGRYQYLGTESEISEREAETVILASAPNSQEKAKALDGLLEGSDVHRTTAQRVVKRLIADRKLTQTGKGKKGNPFRYFLAERVSAQTPHIYGQKESGGG